MSSSPKVSLCRKYGFPPCSPAFTYSPIFPPRNSAALPVEASNTVVSEVGKGQRNFVMNQQSSKGIMMLFGLDIPVQRVAAVFWYLRFMKKEKKCFNHHLVRSHVSRHILHCTKRPPFPARKIPVKCSTGKIYMGISWPFVPAGNLHMLGRGDCRS